MRVRIPSQILGLLTSGRGGPSRRDAELAGVSADRVQRMARAGLLQRVGRGAYAATEQLAAASPWAAFLPSEQGLRHVTNEARTAADWSAVALRGLPCIGAPPALPIAVHPSRTGSGAQQTRYGIVPTRDLPCAHHGSYAGCPIVGAAWMVVDLARTADRTARTRRRGRRPAWRNSRDQPARCVEPALRLAGSRLPPGSSRTLTASESALETLGCSGHRRCLPVPLSNVWVGPGCPMYRVDHLWPWHWVVAEGDGAEVPRARPGAGHCR